MTIGLIPSQVLADSSTPVPEGQTVVPLIKTAPPPYDPDAQKLVAAAPLWFSDRVERQFAVVSLSADELDAIDRIKARARITSAEITKLYQWANDADATTATSGNAVTVLNTLLDRLAPLMRNLADLAKALRLDQ